MNHLKPSENLLYQPHPQHHKPSIFRPKGWSSTVAGYIQEAKQLTCCILRNHKLTHDPYRWHLTINFESILTPKAVASYWVKICRSLRSKGLVALWIREVNLANKVHHHLLIRNQLSEAAVRKIIQAAMPPRSELPWHMRIQAIKDIWQLAHYVCKAKIPGYVGGRTVDDYYQNKRLLLVPKTGLKKYGTVGPFWTKPKKAIWADIRANEKHIAEDLKKRGIQDLVKHIDQLFGSTLPVKKIERSIARWANDEAIRSWCQELITA